MMFHAEDYDDGRPASLDPRTGQYVSPDKFPAILEMMEAITYCDFNDDFDRNWWKGCDDATLSAIILNDAYVPIKFLPAPKLEHQIISVSQAPVMIFYIRNPLPGAFKVALECMINRCPYGLSTHFVADWFKKAPKELHEPFLDYMVQSIDYYFQHEEELIELEKYTSNLGLSNYTLLIKMYTAHDMIDIMRFLSKKEHIDIICGWTTKKNMIQKPNDEAPE